MTDAEIVRTLATKCMGWKEVPWVWGPSLSEHPTEAFFRMNGAGNMRVTVGDNTFWFDPLSFIADAFAVVQKMRELGYKYSLGSSFANGFDGNTPHVAAFVKLNELYRPKLILGADSTPVDISTDQRFFRGYAEAETSAGAISLAAIAALEGK